jgi:hypothetical protein
MELKDRFHKIEAQSESSQNEKTSRLLKITSGKSEAIHWKSDVTAIMSRSPHVDQSFDSTLDLFHKSLTKFLQVDSIQLNVLNLSDDGTAMTHELAVLFSQASELPFEVVEKSINFKMIDGTAYLEVPLRPETKNIVKEAVDYSLTWNKRYQNQLKMNFSFLMGKATLKITYKSGTAQKKKNYIVHTGVTSEV